MISIISTINMINIISIINMTSTISIINMISITSMQFYLKMQQNAPPSYKT